MSDKDSVDARLAEIEQRAKGARYVTFMGGYGETGDARELLSKDVPWLVSQLRDARAENERLRGDYSVLPLLIRERDDLRTRLIAAEAKLAAVRELAEQWRHVEWDGFYPEASAHANAIENCGDALIDLLDEHALAAAEQDEPRQTRTVAQLLREVAERDPEAHNRALARGYGIDRPAEFYGPVSQPTEGSEK